MNIPWILICGSRSTPGSPSGFFRHGFRLKIFSPPWLSLDWVFFCFITQGDVCCHGNRESKGLIQYFITGPTKSKMKHNLPFWKTARQGLKVLASLCHLPVVVGTVIMSEEIHYNLSQFCLQLLMSDTSGNDDSDFKAIHWMYLRH